METILIWLGSGFAFAIGFMAGMIVMVLSLKKQTKQETMTAESIALLKQRNEIGERQENHLNRIALVLESKV